MAGTSFGRSFEPAGRCLMTLDRIGGRIDSVLDVTAEHPSSFRIMSISGLVSSVNASISCKSSMVVSTYGGTGVGLMASSESVVRVSLPFTIFATWGSYLTFTTVSDIVDFVALELVITSLFLVVT